MAEPHAGSGSRSWTRTAITFRCGGERSIAVTMSTVGTADEQTQAGWLVPDLAAEIAELRSETGRNPRVRHA